MPTSASAEPRAWLRRQLAECAYPGYVYGYPHKKAYRSLPEPVALTDAWAGERLDHLYCYVHVPFCGQRCSFCNLFTYVPADASPARPYLDALAREMDGYARALPGARFDHLYLGGGTPTYLTTEELRWLVGKLSDALGVEPSRSRGCVEASPETVDADKVAALREMGFQRVSLGVQSFIPGELREVNRRFDFARHQQAIRLIGDACFPHFNIDLIYGLPGQTPATWERSLREAVASPATSLFLYPLYVRPLTGLAARRQSLDAGSAPTPCEMAAMYDGALEVLADTGFRQVTMRQFRRDRSASGPPSPPGGGGGQERAGEYSCQRDGMLGLGAGARSYTANLHYSTPWRMVARNVRAVIDDYTARLLAGDMRVSYGFALNEDERRRRFVIQSLLHDGLDLKAFREAFGADARRRFADQWEALLAEGCIREEGARYRLTPRGTRHADVVGQMFFSERVRGLMAEYEYDT